MHVYKVDSEEIQYTISVVYVYVIIIVMVYVGDELFFPP